jgi:regulator of cell morphogenesis and NO signaling
MGRIHDAGHPLDAVCAEIVERYHASLHQALPEIAKALGHALAIAPSPELDQFGAAFADLATLIRAHLAKEENLLFPALDALSGAERAGGARPPSPFATLLHPIRVLEAEHLRIEQALDQLQELALTVPEPAARTQAWRRALHDLEHLDRGLRDHHRMENEVLFPRALELERSIL